MMFKLTSKLALSNLKQNRKLYYPFALAVILTTMILYSFIALATTPHLEDSYGGRTGRTVLGFGCFVVQLVVIILVAYANGYVMKNRSKELGLYSVLGMEKKHLLVMTLWELLIFTWVSLSFWPHSFVEFFPPLALQFPSSYAAKESRREEGKILAGPNSFRSRALRNCFLFGANSGASGCGCPRILYCCHFGHSCDLSFIQRRLHYLFKMSQRSEILLLQAREFYIRL